ncbi:hypothetical protein GCM10023142_01610 [Anaerocolumna aminovalerica]|uniref:Uncharacterized protein n=1 Tax=Anaerocolumna aminovalerica TaxID=1527 RepID=A0A1I5BIE2_9FIRM|nr:hypothetical protein [Anaerocolumna aminovalerica]MBU5331499.1 hypothetical protein [Anaerocolumna aminovalerica]SFN74329.1 hypothetical protein SAMN04489757_10120 [Anaerocolumna aminovalerica]
MKKQLRKRNRNMQVEAYWIDACDCFWCTICSCITGFVKTVNDVSSNRYEARSITETTGRTPYGTKTSS